MLRYTTWHKLPDLLIDDTIDDVMDKISCGYYLEIPVDIKGLHEENTALFLEGFPSGQRDQTVNLTRKLRWFKSTSLHQIMEGLAGIKVVIRTLF